MRHTKHALGVHGLIVTEQSLFSLLHHHADLLQIKNDTIHSSIWQWQWQEPSAFHNTATPCIEDFNSPQN